MVRAVARESSTASVGGHRRIPARETSQAELGYARQNLAAAHLITAQQGMDDLVWNHISARAEGSFLITPGEMVFEEVVGTS